MGNHNPPVGNLRRYLGEPPRDVFVGEAMETIAADSLLVELLRDCIAVGNFRMVSMKGCIETGDLQQFVLPRSEGTDRRQIVRLVERSKWRKFLVPLDICVIVRCMLTIVLASICLP